MGIKEHATLPTGLVSYHKLDSDGADATGNGHTGTLQGSPSTPAGKIGDCVDLNGSSQYVEVADDAAFNGTHVSVAAWMYPDVDTGWKGGICKRSSFVGDAWEQIQWTLQFNANTSPAKWDFAVGAATATHGVQSTSDIVTTGWQYVVGTYDGTTVRIYVNGVLETESGGGPGSIVSKDFPILFGARSDGDPPAPYGEAEYLNGKIDEVGIWNRALTETEVGFLYNGGDGLPYEDDDKGLVAPMLVRHAAELGAPFLLSATQIDSTHVDIAFDQEMRHADPGNADDALNPANYTFSVIGGTLITSVASVYKGGTSGKEYRIETTEQTDGAAYTIYANNVKSNYNEVIDPLRNSAEFTGYGDRPAVEDVEDVTSSALTVVFDELMDHDIALESDTSYDISGPTVVTVSSVVAADWPDDKTRCVCQLTGEMTTGEIYTMEVTGVSDASGNPILGNPDNQASFLGVGDHPRVSSAAIPVAGGRSCKIVFSELMASSVLNKDNYTIEGPPGTPLAFQEKDPPGSGVYIENVDDDYTYQLYTAQQIAGVGYTVTVGGTVFDLFGNNVIAPYDEATFTGAGFSPPEVTMNPDDESTDVDIRRKLLITAKDSTTEFTGINRSTWWSRLTFSREGAPMDLVQYAIKDGEIQQGFEGGVYAGDPMDPDTGLTLWVRPLAKKWLELTEYQVETYVEDNEFIPNQNLVTGTFRTGESTCFEDALPTPTTTDTLLMAPLNYPNCEKLRLILMGSGTSSDAGLVKARTLMHLACITDLKTMLAGHFDYALVDNVRLCDRLPVLEVYSRVVRHPKVAKAALDEVPTLTNEARAALLQQLRSSSAIYVVNGVALTVLLCALLDEG